MRRGFLFDVMANIPITVYYIVNVFPTEPETIERVADDPAFLVCMGLKTLRLYHISSVSDTLRRLMQMLSEIFYLKRYLFVNILSWTLTILKFVGAIHYFACGWLMIHYYKEREGYAHVQFSETDSMGMYFESLYAMTTTISTVGYGDYKAFNDNEQGWTVEMAYLIFVTTSGIVLFSLVTNEIFNYRNLLTVDEIVKSKTAEIELYLNDVSKVINTKSLSQEMIDECTEHMGQSIKNSTFYYFKDNKFYQELP